jgi:hypothetical protein
LEYAAAPEQKSNGALRALAVVLALVLILGAAIMIIAMADISGTPTCEHVEANPADLPADRECFDGSSVQKVIAVILGFAGGGIGAIVALTAFAFTFTGRRGRLVLVLTGLAVVLSGISIGVGSI